MEVPVSVRIATLNKKGFTLDEVVVALLVLLLVSLALMQTALVSIDTNMRNLLRDEGVRIADEIMGDTKAVPFENLNGDGLWYQWAPWPMTVELRNGADIPYYPWRMVTDLDESNKRVNVWVSWQYKNGWELHNFTTIVRNPE
jgi:prepilin-type N-terminal cleavage/methylation domain-containing protein